MNLRPVLHRLHLTGPAIGYKGYGYCVECGVTFDRPLIMRAPLRHRFHDFVTTRPRDKAKVAALFDLPYNPPDNERQPRHY